MNVIATEFNEFVLFSEAENEELDLSINEVMDSVDLSHVTIAFEELGAGEKKA